MNAFSKYSRCVRFGFSESQCVVWVRVRLKVDWYISSQLYCLYILYDNIYLSVTIIYLLLSTYYYLPTIIYLLLSTYYYLPTIIYLLLSTYYYLPTIIYLLLSTYYYLPTIIYLLLCMIDHSLIHNNFLITQIQKQIIIDTIRHSIIINMYE